MSRKAQMEIVGLVVIVILISLALLFMLQFGLKEEQGKSVFVRRGLATSTMAALMKITVAGCTTDSTDLVSFEQDLLDDCADYGGFMESSIECEGMHSCDFLNSTISMLLNETLGSLGKRYEFESGLLAETEFLIHIASERGGCRKGRSKSIDTSVPFYLNSGAGLVSSTLKVCD